MAVQQALNVFTSGINKDLNPISLKNDTLTDALNATTITFNGNEGLLLNDMGNTNFTYYPRTWEAIKDENDKAIDYRETVSKIKEKVKLKDGFIPIGIKEHGDIVYIVSHNPKTKESEIGSFPGPEYRPLDLITAEEINTGTITINRSTVDESKIYELTPTEEWLHPYDLISNYQMVGGDADYISQNGNRKLYIPKYINTRTGEDITELIDIQYSNDTLENLYLSYPNISKGSIGVKFELETVDSFTVETEIGGLKLLNTFNIKEIPIEEKYFVFSPHTEFYKITETDIFPGNRICDDELENNLLKLIKLVLKEDFEFNTLILTNEIWESIYIPCLFKPQQLNNYPVIQPIKYSVVYNIKKLTNSKSTKATPGVMGTITVPNFSGTDTWGSYVPGGSLIPSLTYTLPSVGICNYYKTINNKQYLVDTLFIAYYGLVYSIYDCPTKIKLTENNALTWDLSNTYANIEDPSLIKVNEIDIKLDINGETITDHISDDGNNSGFNSHVNLNTEHLLVGTDTILSDNKTCFIKNTAILPPNQRSFFIYLYWTDYENEQHKTKLYITLANEEVRNLGVIKISFFDSMNGVYPQITINNKLTYTLRNPQLWLGQNKSTILQQVASGIHIYYNWDLDYPGYITLNSGSPYAYCENKMLDPIMGVHLNGYNQDPFKQSISQRTSGVYTFNTDYLIIPSLGQILNIKVTPKHTYYDGISLDHLSVSKTYYLDKSKDLLLGEISFNTITLNEVPVSYTNVYDVPPGATFNKSTNTYSYNLKSTDGNNNKIILDEFTWDGVKYKLNNINIKPNFDRNYLYSHTWAPLATGTAWDGNYVTKSILYNRNAEYKYKYFYTALSSSREKFKFIGYSDKTKLQVLQKLTVKVNNKNADFFPTKFSIAKYILGAEYLLDIPSWLGILLLDMSVTDYRDIHKDTEKLYFYQKENGILCEGNDKKYIIYDDRLGSGEYVFKATPTKDELILSMPVTKYNLAVAQERALNMPDLGIQIIEFGGRKIESNDLSKLKFESLLRSALNSEGVARKSCVVGLGFSEKADIDFKPTVQLTSFDIKLPALTKLYPTYQIQIQTIIDQVYGIQYAYMDSTLSQCILEFDNENTPVKQMTQLPEVILSSGETVKMPDTVLQIKTLFGEEVQYYKIPKNKEITLTPKNTAGLVFYMKSSDTFLFKNGYVLDYGNINSDTRDQLGEKVVEYTAWDSRSKFLPRYQRVVIMVEKNQTLYLTFPKETEIYNPYYIYPTLQKKGDEAILNTDTIIDIYRAPAIMINDINNYIVKDEFGLPKYPYLPAPIYEII